MKIQTHLFIGAYQHGGSKQIGHRAQLEHSSRNHDSQIKKKGTYQCQKQSIKRRGRKNSESRHPSGG